MGSQVPDREPARDGDPPGWHVEHDAEVDEAHRVLARDRWWNGYGLADLVPPLLQWTRVAVAQRGSDDAACLFYRHPEFNALIPHGSVDGVAAILDAEAASGRLLPRTSILAKEVHLDHLARHYAFPRGQRSLSRMGVDRQRFRPSATAPRDSAVVRLRAEDLGALQALYESFEESAFATDQLAQGCYFGAWSGERLIAAGGTHVVCPEHRIAAIGNVFTSAEARGRGLATLITSAVARTLLDERCDDVILNVAVDNEPAIHVYRKLGFVEHCQLVETFGELAPSS